MKLLAEQNETVKRLLAKKEKMMADHLKLQIDLQRKMNDLEKRSDDENWVLGAYWVLGIGSLPTSMSLGSVTTD